MCDRVLILYRGRIVQTLQGDAISEHNIIASSLNLELNELTPFEEMRQHG